MDFTHLPIMSKNNKYYLVIFFDENLTLELRRWQKYFFYNKDYINPFPNKKPCLILAAYNEELNTKQLKEDCDYLFEHLLSFEIKVPYISVDTKNQNIFLDVSQNQNLIDFHSYYLLSLRNHNDSLDLSFLPRNYYPVIILTKITDQKRLIATWASISRSRIANKFQEFSTEALSIALINNEQEIIFSFNFDQQLEEILNN